MTTPLVSIILPTFNRAKAVARAVKSVKRQLYSHWELIIVDDGSSLKVIKFLKSLSQTDSRIRVLRQSHAGVSAARNYGSKFAKGQFLAYLDDDDYYLPEHLSSGVSFLLKYPKIAMVYSSVKVIGSNFVPDARNPKKMIRVAQCGHPGTFIIRRSVLARVGWWPDQDFGEDYRLRLNLRRLKYRVKKLPQAYYVYDRGQAKSITKTIHKQYGR